MGDWARAMLGDLGRSGDGDDTGRGRCLAGRVPMIEMGVCAFVGDKQERPSPVHWQWDINVLVMFRLDCTCCFGVSPCSYPTSEAIGFPCERMGVRPV